MLTKINKVFDELVVISHHPQEDLNFAQVGQGGNSIYSLYLGIHRANYRGGYFVVYEL